MFALPADEMESEANFWALMMAGIGIISFVSAIIESWALGISGSRLTERLRSQSFKSMIRQVSSCIPGCFMDFELLIREKLFLTEFLKVSWIDHESFR